MKLVVHGESLVGAPRLTAALSGLALRGHDVAWSGPGAPDVEGIRVLDSAREHDLAAEIVVGAAWPRRVAQLGQRARARAMLLQVSAQQLRGWSAWERWGWESLCTFALAEETEADALRDAVGDRLPLDRFALWSAGDAVAQPTPVHPDVDVLERAGERALARSRGEALRTAAFVDRDGTLIVERGYLADPDGIELLPGVPAALRLLRTAGHPVVIVSNQAGVGRGKFTVEHVHLVMARLRRMLRHEGVEIDAIRFCPHAPDAGCACRKPGTLLFESAAEDLQVSLRGSMMAGDKRLDAASAHAFEGTGVLVRTGYGLEEEARIPQGEYPAPDRVFGTLLEAAEWFATREEGRAAL